MVEVGVSGVLSLGPGVEPAEDVASDILIPELDALRGKINRETPRQEGLHRNRGGLPAKTR